MLLLRPLPLAASIDVSAGGQSGIDYLLTPSPKEVWVGAALGSLDINIDMGAAKVETRKGG